MISSIYSSGGIVASPHIRPHINMSSPSAGMVRYNGSDMEVYDGSTWWPLSSNINMSLDPETLGLLDWARKKRDEDQRIEKLKDNPAITDLLKQRAYIDEKLKIVEILIRDHNGTN